MSLRRKECEKCTDERGGTCTLTECKYVKNSLQDEIADFIKANCERYCEDNSERSVTEESDSILQLPTNMVKVKTHHCVEGNPCDVDDCVYCPNGEEVTNLTLQEKCDIVDMLMEGKAKIRYDHTDTPHILLPDGSKVRRGKVM